jgi:predicted Zn-ribbon and HTH transcriptional regulator
VEPVPENATRKCPRCGAEWVTDANNLHPDKCLKCGWEKVTKERIDQDLEAMKSVERSWAFFEAPGVIPDGKGGGICRACGFQVTDDIAGTLMNAAEVHDHDCPGPDPEKAKTSLEETKAEMREYLRGLE